MYIDINFYFSMSIDSDSLRPNSFIPIITNWWMNSIVCSMRANENENMEHYCILAAYLHCAWVCGDDYDDDKISHRRLNFLSFYKIWKTILQFAKRPEENEFWKAHKKTGTEDSSWLFTVIYCVWIDVGLAVSIKMLLQVRFILLRTMYPRHW